MRTLLVVALLVGSPVLAGCLDGGDNVDPAATEGTNLTKDLFGNRTQLDTNVTGLAKNASEEKHLPHVHNYWGERDRVLLADETIELNPWMTFNWVFGFRDPSVGGAYWELPQGKTIYQGTGKLEITLDWQDATVSALAIKYRSAAGPEWSEWVPADKAATVTIDVTPEMTDLPHSGGSRWSFLFKSAQSPGLSIGNVKLKAEIVRVGDLHSFPAHEDFFAGSESLVIMDAPTESKSSSWTSNVLQFANGQQEFDEGFSLPEGSIVPPETKLLILDLKIEGVAERGVYFSYRDASGRYDRGESLESPEPGVYRFVVFVESDGVDSYYAATSGWRFFVYADTGGSNGLPFNCGGCTDQTVKLHATIEAFRVPPDGFGESDSEEPGNGGVANLAALNLR